MVTRLLAYVRGLARRDAIRAEVDEELRFHLDKEVEAHIARGVSPQEARRMALRDLGGFTQTREAVGDLRTIWGDALLQDARYALRMFRRTPGFTIVAVVTIALGIGVNLAVFTLADGMLFRSLPYEHADDLVLIQGFDRQRGQATNMVYGVEYEHLRTRHSGITGIAAARSDALWTWIGPAGPESVQTAAATPNLFEVIGVRPHAGRVLWPGDESAEPLPVMLTFELWSQRFGQDSSVIGRTVSFAHRTVQVVGVLPSRFMLPAQGQLGAGQLLFLKALDPKVMTSARAGVLSPVARLKPGVSLAAAQNEADVLMRQVSLQYPEIRAERALRLADVQYALFELRRPVLWLLVAAAGGVLLITCVNLASLLLARGALREREIGIRTAMGATRSRVARQFLVESLILAVMAGTLVFGVSAITANLLIGYVPPHFQLRTDLFEGRTVGFVALLSVIAGLLFGIGPALRVAGAPPNLALREPRRTGEGRARLFRTGPLLVIAEVALTVTVFAGTALTAHSLIRQRTADLGFAAENVVTVPVGRPPAQRVNPTHAFEFQRRVLAEVRQLPGVRASAIDVTHVGREMPTTGLPDGTGIRSVLPGYFETMGIQIIEGRDFVEADIDAGNPVAIVPRSFAEAEWPRQAALGRTIQRDGIPQMTVVGVIGDVRVGYGGRIDRAIYGVLSGSSYTPMTIVARAPGDPSALAAAIRTILQRLLPGTVIPQPRLLPETLFLAIRETQFQTMLFGLFGVVALMVATIGIYGVMTQWVNTRTRELGVRLALGAEPGLLKALVVRQAAGPLLVGLALGLGGAVAFGRQLKSLLYEISPQDPATLAFTAGMLLIVGLLAAYLPARRAARVDPLVTLRAE